MTKNLQYGSHSVSVYDSREVLSSAAAAFIYADTQKRLKEQERYFLALSGGSTPRALYSELAADYANKISWSDLEIYFGDERYVPHDHQQSNYRMADETLLSHIAIPEEQIHPTPTDCGDIDECTARYIASLSHLPQRGHAPCFDLVLLGMGDDGHTASLFPGSRPLLEVHQPAASAYIEKHGSWRITLTYPVLNAARRLLVLVTGKNKAPILKAVLTDPECDYPIAGIHNPGGILWFIDSDAAEELLE